jgi:hypothetical protein
LLLLLSNGRSWIYAISLFASQYSLVIHWRCGPVLGTQRGDLCPLLCPSVCILCSSCG